MFEFLFFYKKIEISFILPKNEISFFLPIGWANLPNSNFFFFVEFQADFQEPYESRFWKFKMGFGALIIYHYLPIEIASDFNKI